MSPYFLAQAVCTLLLILLFALCSYHLKKLSSRPLRHSAQFFLLSALLYNSLLSIVRMPQEDVHLIYFISQCIFFSSHTSLLGLLLFSIFFLDKGQELRRPHCIALILVTCLLMIASFAGHLTSGIEKIEQHYRPIDGPLRPAANVFYLVVLAYLLYLFISSYRRSREGFVRKQIAFVGVTVFVSLGSAILFNGIIPTFLRNSNYHFVSQFAFVILAYVFLFLHLRYQKSFARQALDELLKLPYFATMDNVIMFQQLLNSSIRYLSNGHTKWVERFDFRSPEHKEVRSFYLSSTPPEALQNDSLLEYFPAKAYMESMERLEKENISLGLQIQMAHELLHDSVPLKKLIEYKNSLFSVEESLGLGQIQARLTPLEHSERREVIKYLYRNNYNKASTAKHLGITLNTLKKKLSKYHIKMPQEDRALQTLKLPDLRFAEQSPKKSKKGAAKP